MSEILPQPEKPSHLPLDVQWLSGQGAGSWFYLSKSKMAREIVYRIIRYSPSGEVECDNLFEVDDSEFSMNEAYQFTYLSHCALCTILQGEKEFVFRLRT